MRRLAFLAALFLCSIANAAYPQGGTVSAYTWALNCRESVRLSDANETLIHMKCSDGKVYMSSDGGPYVELASSATVCPTCVTTDTVQTITARKTFSGDVRVNRLGINFEPDPRYGIFMVPALAGGTDNAGIQLSVGFGPGEAASAYGITIAPGTNTGADITNAIGIRVHNLEHFGGAADNWFGLYIDTPTGGSTLNRGIYVVGGTSEFGGDVIVGGSLTGGAHTHTGSSSGGQISDAALSSPIGATKGGTGQTAATKGDLLVATAANTWSRLPGYATTSLKVLSQFGTGTEVAGTDWIGTTGTGNVARTGAPTFTGTSSFAGLSASETISALQGVVFGPDGSIALGEIATSEDWGLTARPVTGFTYDFVLSDVTGNDPVLAIPAGTTSVQLFGNPVAPTAATADNDTSIATTAFVKAQAYAPLASPALTGTPTAPTATAGTSTTQLATTAFVATSFAPLAAPTFTSDPKAPTPSAADSDTSIATTSFVQTETLNQTEGDARYARLSGGSGALFTGNIGAANCTTATRAVTVCASTDPTFGLYSTSGSQTERGTVRADSTRFAFEHNGNEFFRGVGANTEFAGTLKERGRSVALGEFTGFTPTRTTNLGTWTGGSITTAKYSLVGKTMTVLVKIDDAALSSTPTLISIDIPNSMTATGEVMNPVSVKDCGTVRTGTVRVSASGTKLDISPREYLSGTWTGVCATNSVAFSFTFEVN